MGGHGAARRMGTPTMTRMTIAQARRIADTPSVSVTGKRIPTDRLVQARQVLDCEGHGDGRDARRLRGLLLTIERRMTAVPAATGAGEALEWNRVNVGAAFQHHSWGV